MAGAAAAEPLSSPQRKMLANVECGRSPFASVFGSAAHGGASGTLASLLRRGLLKRSPRGRYEVTEAGRSALRGRP